MDDKHPTGRMPAPPRASASVRPVQAAAHAGARATAQALAVQPPGAVLRAPAKAKSPGKALRLAAVAVAIGLVAGGGALASGLVQPFGNAEAQKSGVYVRDVQVAVNSLTLVFAQADESVKAFQNGWLAPEGAASQFGFLHKRVQVIKSEINEAEPPADMQQFHKQLGRSVTLTQQAMDAMQYGFTSGDPSYFELAGQKLGEARTTLDRAVDEL
jgi:hypothetical protein